MMRIPCTPPKTHDHNDRRRSDSSQYAPRRQGSPQFLLHLNSLRIALPSRQVLLRHQSTLWARRESVTPPPPTLQTRKIMTPNDPSAQRNSIMAMKVEHWKDKWRGFKKRASPAVFRFAGHMFLAIVLIALGSVIVGWYGLSKDTLAYKTETTEPATQQPAPPDHRETRWPTQTSPPGQLNIRIHDSTHALPLPTTDPETALTTTSEDLAKITVIQTIILTVTSVYTDMSLKTVTTTVFLSTCTGTACLTTPTSTNTNTPAPTTTTYDIMTGLMYCSFTGRPHIYTLCPLVHTNGPGMLSTQPAMASSATSSSAKNPFSAVRLTVVSLWNSFPGLGRVLPKEKDRSDVRERECNCVRIKKKLDSAVDLVRLQKQLLDSQRAMIAEHRRTLTLALEMVANVTAAAARAGSYTPRGRPLDLKI
ncbi:hypothetical protein HD806DRAFT_525696 [Xylariaceae sp. AK1471]|nr:hypothetical protein HD806DRAFT_525696 [Xylariaceae sp. AK1471]